MKLKYSNLRVTRRELKGFLINLSEHHPIRSLIENALYNVEKIIATDPTTKACTPEKGYVEMRLKETGRY